MELLECEPPSPSATEDRTTWFSYLERFSKTDTSESEEIRNEMRKRPLFLKRNRRKPMVVTVDEIKKEKEDDRAASADETDSSLR